MKNAFLITFGLIGMSLFISNAYALSNFTISGRLKDSYNNSLQAKITLYQIGAGNFTNSTETDANGSYSMLVQEGLYDIEFNITNFSTPFWVKFLSVNLAYDMYDLLAYATEHRNNVSLIVNTTENYTIQLYSKENPKRVLINDTTLTNTSSILNLTSDTWFYNGSDKNLYILPFKKNLPWLHVNGKWIEDELGRRAALRGVAGRFNCYHYGGLNDVLYSPGGWKDRIDWLKQQGLTSVRLFGVSFDNPQWDLELLDGIIDYFEQRGIYITITAGYGEGELGTVYEDGSWIGNWTIIAERYKNRSVVFAYELANEGTWKYNEYGDHNYTRKAFKDCVNAIRQYDNKHILVLYEPVRSWGSVEMALQYPKTIWLRRGIVWDPADMPNDNNIAFKFGNHWLVLRYWAIYKEGYEQAYEYYKDKFDLAYAWTSEYVECLRNWRDLFNRPVLNYEFGHYDSNMSNANYAGSKDHIRLCEDAEIPWNFHWFDEYIGGSSSKYYDWRTYLANFTGSYSSPYFDGLVEPFKPKPFNLRDYTTEVHLTWNRMTSGTITLSDGNYWVTMKGPCTIREMVFNYSINGAKYPDFRGLSNFAGDRIVTINESENVTFKNEIGGELGGTVFIFPNSIHS